MLQDIIDRLKAKAPSLHTVLPAEELDAIAKGVAPRGGTTFVLPYRERARPNDIAMGAFRQSVRVQFLVAFVVRRHDDGSGGKKALTFDLLKSEIEMALAGWAPSRENDRFELVAAQASPLGNGVSVYVQTWETSRFLEVRP
ncbi:hypothetical protein RHIZ_02865 [Rhizobium skierniewicense]|uniref:phage tail terminator protein n=1 Tax=Rhizobium skierniewicense TaxID=984260 RepID=UPI001FAB7679|nr:hypothetical protein [Rhizobium skierniewicense]MCI9864882.1 hypothetical protein [Rhizobium skierniewicense]